MEALKSGRVLGLHCSLRPRRGGFFNGKCNTECVSWVNMFAGNRVFEGKNVEPLCYEWNLVRFGIDSRKFDE